MNVLVMAEGAPCGALGGVVQWCASLGASISVTPDDPFGEVTFLEQLFGCRIAVVPEVDYTDGVPRVDGIPFDFAVAVGPCPDTQFMHARAIKIDAGDVRDRHVMHRFSSPLCFSAITDKPRLPQILSVDISDMPYSLLHSTLSCAQYATCSSVSNHALAVCMSYGLTLLTDRARPLMSPTALSDPLFKTRDAAIRDANCALDRALASIVGCSMVWAPLSIDKGAVPPHIFQAIEGCVPSRRQMASIHTARFHHPGFSHVVSTRSDRRSSMPHSSLAHYDSLAPLEQCVTWGLQMLHAHGGVFIHTSVLTLAPIRAQPFRSPCGRVFALPPNQPASSAPVVSMPCLG